MSRISPTLLLRIGLGFVFLYAGVTGITSPADWIGFLPTWIDAIISAEIALLVFSIFEIVLALWLFVGWQTRIASLVAAVFLLGISLSSLHLFIITFRDVGLFFAALALFVSSSHGSN